MRKDTRSVCHLKITYPTDHSRWAVCERYPQYLLSFSRSYTMYIILPYIGNPETTNRWAVCERYTKSIFFLFIYCYHTLYVILGDPGGLAGAQQKLVFIKCYL